VTIPGNEKRIVFDSFCLDLANERLWKGSQPIRLRPKVFALLDHLLRRPGLLVTKEELIEAVWPGTFVGDSVLKAVVRQLRKALGDDAKHPRFIETAHRRGYRFIGAIAAPPQTGPSAMPHPSMDAAAPPQTVVGREEALSRMRTCLHKTLRGERQVLFVTGEAGIGKTALVDAFVQSLVFDEAIRTARGQCLEQYGTSEAYLPVLEAIGRLCRENAQVVDVVRTNAPMWLLQMPSLLSASDREVLSREMSGATHERMLREMSGALEALTAGRPLVLILEDLHWSDYSTLDLISYLARQPQPAPLMLIGTYRTAELMVRGHPLNAVKRELLAKQQCEQLPLQDLSEKAVATYLTVRFPGNRFPPKLAAAIHQRTEGNPLFMVNAVDYLVAEKSIDLREGTWDLVVDMENVQVGGAR
jgi:DNA-binding winged helix-turn-helix (wHTH) protein